MVTQGKDFDETYHWHSGKPLADDFEAGTDFKGNTCTKQFGFRVSFFGSSIRGAKRTCNLQIILAGAKEGVGEMGD